MVILAIFWCVTALLTVLNLFFWIAGVGRFKPVIQWGALHCLTIFILVTGAQGHAQSF